MSALKVKTALGSFTIALHDLQAPATCAYFRRLAECGALDGGGIFRITTTADDAVPAIEIIQFGTSKGLDEHRTRIPHESTAQTGLAHRRWTASAARMDPGEVYSSVFICMRDEPSLDSGGTRHADGFGFAAFGEVVTGHDVLEMIFRHARPGEMLPEPIRVEQVAFIEQGREARR
jgi:peptidyl-prolyl cis-trans isomerase A (cyclophilin A)